MPPKKKAKKKQIADYRHEDATRPNNPPAALARDDTANTPKVKYEFDPHRDPQLVWAGKAEQEAIEVDAPSLHIHERISAEAILRHAQREDAELTLFADSEMERSKAIEFYEHEMGWANRLILGDSLVVMNSLLERERMAGQVQMIYIDPPFGIDYNSNFQPKISNPRPPKDSESTISRQPEQIQAYRDTWELGVHSYLSYIRDRLVLSRDLISDSGSLFFQIGRANMPVIGALLDEIFGPTNRVAIISMQKSGTSSSALLPETTDYIFWYAKDKEAFKGSFRPLYEPFDLKNLDTRNNYKFVEDQSGNRREMTREERNNPRSLDPSLRPFKLEDPTSQNPSKTRSGPYTFQGKELYPDSAGGTKRQWSVAVPEGLDRLADLNRLQLVGNTLRYVRYLDDFPVQQLNNVWLDTGRSGFGETLYVVQTNPKAIERCVLMSTEPGDLIMDPTCGSGTSAWVAERHGRRWITSDTSRVAIAVTRQRLLTAKFPFYEMAQPEEGIQGGFDYEAVKKVEKNDLATDQPSKDVPLRNQPKIRSSLVRVSGPFSFESISRYGENPIEEDLVVPVEMITGDESSEGEDAGDHRDLLLEALRHHGIPIQGKKPLKVETLEPIAGSGSIHAEGKVRSGKSEKTFAVSLGPRYGPVTQIQVDDALDEAKGYDLVVFVGFTATAEVQEYLAPGRRGKVEVALVEANADLLLGDLLKNTSGSQTFRLFSSPDAEAKKAKDGEFTVELHGMDSYDAATGEVTSRSRDEIAAWFLDHDYDGTVFHVNQAFFTRADAWDALKKALKAEIDPEALEALNGFESLPFKLGESGRAAIRVIDDAGQTSEMVLELKGK